jgi:hypothetical protein
MDKATFLSIMAGLTSGSFLIGQQLGGQTVATIEASYNETIAGLTTETGKTPAVVGLSITGNKGTGTLAELTTLAEFLAANGVTIVQGYYEPVL